MNQENGETHQKQERGEGVLTKDPSELILSYFTCPQDAAGAFLGALMLTDYRARPVHFSFVSPIRPTRFQRILFGSTLEEHVNIDVVGQKLLKDIPSVPDVLFVDRQELVALRQITDIPTAFLSRSADDEADAARLTTLAYDTSSNTEDEEIVGRILASLETFVDLIEPFNRMREALKEAIKSADA